MQSSLAGHQSFGKWFVLWFFKSTGRKEDLQFSMWVPHFIDKGYCHLHSIFKGETRHPTCFHFNMQIAKMLLNTTLRLKRYCKSIYKLLLPLSRFSHLWLGSTPSTAAHQAPQSLGFSRQKHWSRLPLPSPIYKLHTHKYNSKTHWFYTSCWERPQHHKSCSCHTVR